MELKQIKELMAAMGRSGTTRLSLKKDNFELNIEREVSDIGYPIDYSMPPMEEQPRSSVMTTRTDQTLARGAEMPTGRVSSPITSETKAQEDINSLYITSPMVGTFYTSPSPEDAPFVKVGDKIDKNTVVCIIEAMKVMNEIKAGMGGTVVEVLIETGQPVEFGTKLFRIVES